MKKPWLIESLTNYCMWLFKIILYICDNKSKDYDTT